MASGDSLVYFDALAGLSPAASPARIDLRNGTAVLDFADADDERTDFVGVLPAHYGGGGLTLRLVWACTSAVTGSVRWAAEFERRPIDDPVEGSYQLDTDDFQSAVVVDSAAPAVAGGLAEATLAISPALSGNAQAGEPFRVRVTRRGTDATDTAAGDAELLSAWLSEA